MRGGGRTGGRMEQGSNGQNSCCFNWCTKEAILQGADSFPHVKLTFSIPSSELSNPVATYTQWLLLTSKVATYTHWSSYPCACSKRKALQSCLILLDGDICISSNTNVTVTQFQRLDLFSNHKAVPFALTQQIKGTN